MPVYYCTDEQLMESERALVAHALTEPQVIDRVLVQPEHFSHRPLGRLWARCQDLRREGQDEISFLQAGVDREGMLELTQYFDCAGEYHAKRVRDAWMRRTGHALLEELIELNQERYDTAEQYIAAVQHAVMHRMPRPHFNRLSWAEAVDKVYAQIQHAAHTEGVLPGLPTGLTDLDEHLGGLHPTYIVLAGRPGMGKTALAMTIASNVGARGKWAVVFSMENDAELLVRRALAARVRVPVQKMLRGQIDSDEWHKIFDVKEELKRRCIIVDDTPGLTSEEIMQRARALKAQYDIELMIVDHVQRVRERRKYETRRDEVSRVSNTLAAAPGELGIPCIAVCQLTRAAEEEKRPQMKHLKESGDLEQDARVILFPFRPAYYAKQIDVGKEPGKIDPNLAELRIAKNSEGELGTIKLCWEGEYTSYRDWVGKGEPDAPWDVQAMQREL